MPRPTQAASRAARKLVVGVLGGSVLALGLVMLVTPGPAIVVIPAGLGILALEFAFAKRWLRALKRRLNGKAKPHGPGPSASPPNG